MLLRRCFLATIVLVTGQALPAPPKDIRVIDGDTINAPIAFVDNFPERISLRLLGVNTPETGGKAKCKAERDAGEAAKLYVRDRIANAKDVKLVHKNWDKYGGRVDAYVVIDGDDLARDLIKGGYAIPYNGHGPRKNVWCK